MTLNDTIAALVRRYPAVRAALTPRARWVVAMRQPAEYKTAEFMQRTIESLVRGVYGGFVGGEFIDIMANLIQGQLTQAYNRALADEGLVMDEDFAADLERLILAQFDYVDQYFRDIVDARIDGTPIEPLIVRASLWANRYNETYSEAQMAIAKRFGGKMIWMLGATEEHCPTCAALNGIVAFATEWETAGFRPQNAPNDLLACGGWRCDCSLTITEKRRSPKALDTLLDIATMGNV
jgi:hypothetical protein